MQPVKVLLGRTTSGVINMRELMRQRCLLSSGAAPPQINSTPPGDLRFDNHEAAFRHKSTRELVRAFAILGACSSNWLVDHSLQLMRSGERLLGSHLFAVIMRQTLYAQFVAGETGEGVIDVARGLHVSGLQLMVAPTLEADLGEYDSDQRSIKEMNTRNYKELMRLVCLVGDVHNEVSLKQQLHQQRPHPLPSLQIKMTGLVSVKTLVATSQALLALRENEENYLEVIESIATAIRNSNNDSEVSLRIPGLEPLHVVELSQTCRRLRNICTEAESRDVRLLVDMEWSYVNPACSAVASALMSIYNHRTPMVCSTVQCYLKGALATLNREMQVCRQLGVCYGAKLVRGAYIEKENQVAPDGVCASYEETGLNYDRVMERAVRAAVSMEPQRCLIIVATHNEVAVQRATGLLHTLGASYTNNVAFAQIYGMSEQISLPLAQAGYAVYKSVAFGELGKVLPYLARRAAENKAVMQGARKERQLLFKEISRRMKL